MNRAFSFGGGRQSTAALVLAAQGKLDVDLFVFANVGNDSENPDTLEYVEHYAKPFAAAHGIELVEVQRKFKDGRDPSLYQYVLHEKRGVAIPMRMADTGAPGRRKCTTSWKIEVIARYLKRDCGWPSPWQQLLGIAWDESHRMRDPETVDDLGYWRVYPLCDMRITTADCLQIVRDAGLPRPPKSSCWFCPFHDLSAWRRLRLTKPELFDRAVDLERTISERHVDSKLARGDALYLTNRLKPLDVAIPEGAEQLEMFDDQDAACTSGYCWT